MAAIIKRIPGVFQESSPAGENMLLSEASNRLAAVSVLNLIGRLPEYSPGLVAIPLPL